MFSIILKFRDIPAKKKFFIFKSVDKIFLNIASPSLQWTVTECVVPRVYNTPVGRDGWVHPNNPSSTGREDFNQLDPGRNKAS